ncbi:MAG: hypothetical protein V9F03_15345 [Microthrixaceae bacterium]
MELAEHRFQSVKQSIDVVVGGGPSKGYAQRALCIHTHGLKNRGRLERLAAARTSRMDRNPTLVETEENRLRLHTFDPKTDDVRRKIRLAAIRDYSVSRCGPVPNPVTQTND